MLVRAPFYEMHPLDSGSPRSSAQKRTSGLQSRSVAPSVPGVVTITDKRDLPLKERSSTRVTIRWRPVAKNHRLSAADALLKRTRQRGDHQYLVQQLDPAGGERHHAAARRTIARSLLTSTLRLRTWTHAPACRAGELDRSASRRRRRRALGRSAKPSSRSSARRGRQQPDRRFPYGAAGYLAYYMIMTAIIVPGVLQARLLVIRSVSRR